MWPSHGWLDLAQEILELILAADEARGSKRTTTDFLPVPETYRPLLGTYFAAPGIWVNIEWRGGALRLAVPQGRDSSLHAPAELVPTENELEFRVRGARGAGEMAVFKIEEGVAGYALGAFEFRQLKI